MPSRPRPRADLGELESAVMGRLWAAKSPLTVRDVLDQMSDQRTLAYTTVMTVLDRLAKKGLANRERDGRAWRYTAAATREQLTARMLRDRLGELGGNERREVLMHFLDDASDQDRDALRAALDALERRST